MAKDKANIAKSTLREKLLKGSTIEETSLLVDSKFYNEKDMVPTEYPMINVALSGRVDGGLTPGITQIAGESKHFKSMFALLLGAAYLKKYPDAIMVFYDSEFGTPKQYFKHFGIDTSRVIHKPLVNIEIMKFDAVTTLESLERGEKVVFVIDSIGSLASKKELEDAIAGKSVADVGNRARALKSFFRMVTPYFNLRDIPCIVVNHTYNTLEMFSKPVVGGGTGSIYSSENIWIVGRRQEKEDKTIVGYHFIINVEKSRYLKEKSKIPISVTFEKGIQKHSGVLDLALEGNFLTKVGHSYYLVDEDGVVDDKKQSYDVANSDEFLANLLKTTKLASWIKKKYSLDQE